MLLSRNLGSNIKLLSSIVFIKYSEDTSAIHSSINIFLDELYMNLPSYFLI